MGILTWGEAAIVAAAVLVVVVIGVLQWDQRRFRREQRSWAEKHAALRN